MTLSASLADSPIFGLIVGSIVTLAAAWWFWQKRTVLYYGMPVAVRVIDAPPAARARMVLSVDGTVREHPHRVEVQLICKGPKDIASSDFDQDRPIILDVGADIITTIGSPQVEPSDAEIPNVTCAGRTLSVPKCLIRRGQRISVSLLVDGAPNLTRQQIRLHNVTPKGSAARGLASA